MGKSNRNKNDMYMDAVKSTRSRERPRSAIIEDAVVKAERRSNKNRNNRFLIDEEIEDLYDDLSGYDF